MDEATLARARRVFGEQPEDMELFAEQLGRWQAETLSGVQRQEVQRLTAEWRREVAAILELADALKDNTIEALLRKSDLQVGIEALLGHGPRRRQRRQKAEAPGRLLSAAGSRHPNQRLRIRTRRRCYAVSPAASRLSASTGKSLLRTCSPH